ncbi:MAG: STAS domain-containing protein [Bdellovibrionales bacterium]|nr:STAS domain-containing protein [Bdellovibrionales bacterium]
MFGGISTDSSKGAKTAMDIEFQTSVSGGKGLISLEGDLDNEAAGEALRRAFNKIFDRGERTIVLDMDKVQIINSYGIGKILMCYKRLQAEGGVLMVKPLKGFVKETFELLMLDRLFPVDGASGSGAEA